MRYLLASVVLLSVAMTACDRRQNIAVVPDRQNHAYGAGGVQQPISQRPTASEGEMYHTLQANESISSVARKYNVDLGWLIRRNDIQDSASVKVGDQLIVPRIQMAPAMETQPAPAPRKPSTPSAGTTRPR